MLLGFFRCKGCKLAQPVSQQQKTSKFEKLCVTCYDKPLLGKCSDCEEEIESKCGIVVERRFCYNCTEKHPYCSSCDNRFVQTYSNKKQCALTHHFTPICKQCFAQQFFTCLLCKIIRNRNHLALASHRKRNSPVCFNCYSASYCMIHSDSKECTVKFIGLCKNNRSSCNVIIACQPIDYCSVCAYICVTCNEFVNLPNCNKNDSYDHHACEKCCQRMNSLVQRVTLLELVYFLQSFDLSHIVLQY